ncbi:Prophage minor tail protein Z (GPZ) [Nitrosospira sp. Nsp11]|uniref:phage tail protein n=1 Tax=Nitrosospira sp. Nsp11 TaxID=1855338 RepID=UPI00091D5592|nr:phage tail protein [Nitrosospira sp. Nsp11]SHM05786.1 Prophage minor tail protein Z (GPZ) [Nitrosospira sp. Nsp11]
MIKVSVKADISKALAKLGSIPKEVMDKAVPRALNKVAAETRTESSRSIRAVGYNLGVNTIKRRIDIRKANRNVLKAVLRVTGKPIPLINYAARQTKKGVSVKVKSGRKVIQHAFIATMPTGHIGVVVRVGTAHKMNRKNVWSGLPIKQLFGPSIPTAFSNEVVQQTLRDKIKNRFPILLKHELQYLSLKR